MTGILGREKCGRDTHREDGHMKTEAGLESCCHKPRNVSNHWKLEKAKKDSSLEVGLGAWPWQPLDFGLLGSRTVRK